MKKFLCQLMVITSFAITTTIFNATELNVNQNPEIKILEDNPDSLLEKVECTWSGSAGVDNDGTNYCLTEDGLRVEARVWTDGYIHTKIYYTVDEENRVDYKWFYHSNGNKDYYEDWNQGRVIQTTQYVNNDENRVDYKWYYYQSGRKNYYEDWYAGSRIQTSVYENDADNQVDYKWYYHTNGNKSYYEDWDNGHKIQHTQYVNNDTNYVDYKIFYNKNGERTEYQEWFGGNLVYTDLYTNGVRTERVSNEKFVPQLTHYVLTCEYECYEGHNGTDIQSTSPSYTTTNSYNKVKAVAAGKVVDTGSGCDLHGSLGNTCNYGAGNYVVIDHGNNRRTIYEHLQSPKVSVGAYLEKGDYIGTEGGSGNVSGVHSHLSYTVNGVYKDPETVIDYKSSAYEYEGSNNQLNYEYQEGIKDTASFLEYLNSIITDQI